MVKKVTLQELIDVGFNGFGLQLFVESIAKREGVDNFDKFQFEYKGVLVTLEPAAKVDGSAASEKEVCNLCGGKGWMEVPVNSSTTAAPSSARATCPECKPSGWLHSVTDGNSNDLALSFYPDSFPLEGVVGYRSTSGIPPKPLYTREKG